MSHTLWVRLPHYLEISGEKRRTFLKLRADGHLVEGTHYQEDALKRIWVNTEAMTAWIEGKPLKLREA